MNIAKDIGEKLRSNRFTQTVNLFSKANDKCCQGPLLKYEESCERNETRNCLLYPLGTCFEFYSACKVNPGKNTVKRRQHTQHAISVIY